MRGRRWWGGAAGLVLLALLALAFGCEKSGDVTAGSQHDWYDSSWIGRMFDRSPAQPTPTEAPSPAAPTFESPELDDTLLQANLRALSAADRALADHHLGAPLGEGTWIFAAPMTVEEARLRLLGPDPQPASQRDFTGADSSAYAFLQVGRGVLAWEPWGFADPPRRLLAELSRDGASSAVVTDNIEGMTRFGYARDGHVVFNAHEYAFVDSIDEIPAEVRDLARLAWTDLTGPLVETSDYAAVGLAMAEKVTGVRADPAVRDVSGKENWFAVPMPWGGGENG